VKNSLKKQTFDHKLPRSTRIQFFHKKIVTIAYNQCFFGHFSKVSWMATMQVDGCKDGSCFFGVVSSIDYARNIKLQKWLC
jgi:hypothetical protein